MAVTVCGGVDVDRAMKELHRSAGKEPKAVAFHAASVFSQ
jgi:hypothetical protein